MLNIINNQVSLNAAGVLFESQVKNFLYIINEH